MCDATFVTNAELDRLVDGELSPPEQRALLLRLEQEADGWRRLALAFVEDQALRDACPGLLADGPAISANAIAASAARVSRFRGTSIAMLMAAAMLCAFLVGLRWNVREPQPLRSGMFTSVDQPPLSANRPMPDRMRVVFPEPSGDWSDPVELPVVNGDDARAQWWLNGDPFVPAAVRNALREAGQQVSEQRHWMQVDLEDGRLGYVPVSELVVSSNDPSRYP